MSESPTARCSEESCMVSTVDSLLTSSLYEKSGKEKKGEYRSNCLGEKRSNINKTLGFDQYERILCLS